MKEYQYKEEYVRALDSMKVKWDEISDAKQMGGTGKPSRLTAQKNICGSVRARRTNLKSELWIDELKAPMGRKETALIVKGRYAEPIKRKREGLREGEL